MLKNILVLLTRFQDKNNNEFLNNWKIDGSKESELIKSHGSLELIELEYNNKKLIVLNGTRIDYRPAAVEDIYECFDFLNNNSKLFEVLEYINSLKENNTHLLVAFHSWIKEVLTRIINTISSDNSDDSDEIFGILRECMPNLFVLDSLGPLNNKNAVLSKIIDILEINKQIYSYSIGGDCSILPQITAMVEGINKGQPFFEHAYNNLWATLREVYVPVFRIIECLGALKLKKYDVLEVDLDPANFKNIFTKELNALQETGYLSEMGWKEKADNKINEFKDWLGNINDVEKDVLLEACLDYREFFYNIATGKDLINE